MALGLAGAMIAAMAVAALAQSSEPATPSTPPPIAFFVAKGGPGACGPGCQEWIAAEGAFDSDAEPRLWELLRKLGNRKLPVFFHSGGGLVPAAFEVGRLIRQRGLTAGVGLTIPANCDPDTPRADACARRTASGEELAPAKLDSGHAQCASACVYAFLGGAVHEVAAATRLGIHDVWPSATVMRADEDGHIRPMPQKFSEQDLRKMSASADVAIAAYLRQMGIRPDLLAAARAVPHEQLHNLTREEIVAFGIDGRDAAESMWGLRETPAGANAIKLIEVRDREASTFHREVVSVTCRDKTTAQLQYLRETPGGEAAPTGLRLVSGGRSVSLTRVADMPQKGSRPPMARHSAYLPLSALDAATFVIESNETSGQSAESPAHAPLRLTIQGAAPPLATLAQRCSTGGQ
jgi:hypothetical protein